MRTTAYWTTNPPVETGLSQEGKTMSLLEQIHRGKEPLPPRITLYGPEGVGKSTCGSGAPGAVFIDVEGGLGEIECARFPRVKTIEDVFAALTELRSTPHDFKSVVIDTADALERVRQMYPEAA